MGRRKSIKEKPLARIEKKIIRIADPSPETIQKLSDFKCTKCATPTRFTTRKHERAREVVETPTLRCTKKGCQNYCGIINALNHVAARETEKAPTSDIRNETTTGSEAQDKADPSVTVGFSEASKTPKIPKIPKTQTQTTQGPVPQSTEEQIPELNFEMPPPTNDNEGMGDQGEGIQDNPNAQFNPGAFNPLPFVDQAILQLSLRTCAMTRLAINSIFLQKGTFDTPVIHMLFKHLVLTSMKKIISPSSLDQIHNILMADDGKGVDEAAATVGELKRFYAVGNNVWQEMFRVQTPTGLATEVSEDGFDKPTNQIMRFVAAAQGQTKREEGGFENNDFARQLMEVISSRAQANMQNQTPHIEVATSDGNGEIGFIPGDDFPNKNETAQ